MLNNADFFVFENKRNFGIAFGMRNVFERVRKLAARMLCAVVVIGVFARCKDLNGNKKAVWLGLRIVYAYV